MKVIFLGTNGWYDTATGNTPCVLVETQEQHIIFDAGLGFYKVKDIVKSEKPILLFISHLHLDHIIGLHTLPLFKFAQGIDIYVPKVMEKDLHSFLRKPFTSSPHSLPTKLRFHALNGNAKFPFAFEMKRLRHSVPCYGYRLELDGKTVSYCTDTGACANLNRLAADADLFITECAMKPGDKAMNIFHLTPETAATVARDAKAKHLALCHFDPGKYPSYVNRAVAETAARKIFPSTIAAQDGTVIAL
jgi:ribonuclease BN (tRNA processing enzyme)